MILFCLPYAGGSSSAFFKWDKLLDPSIELFAVELKGRGKRFNEKYYKSLDEAVEDIFNNIKYRLNDDYAIFGHSMGSLLAYELYYKIVSCNIKKPRHIFFSGYKAPSKSLKKTYINKLSDSDIFKTLIELGGIPEYVIENKQLIEIFLPIIRNDFMILEEYVYKQPHNKIDCDVSIFNGKEDSFKTEEITAWKDHCEKDFNIYNFDGNHFFINNNIEKITSIINKSLVL